MVSEQNLWSKHFRIFLPCCGTISETTTSYQAYLKTLNAILFCVQICALDHTPFSLLLAIRHWHVSAWPHFPLREYVRGQELYWSQTVIYLCINIWSHLARVNHLTKNHKKSTCLHIQYLTNLLLILITIFCRTIFFSIINDKKSSFKLWEQTGETQ